MALVSAAPVKDRWDDKDLIPVEIERDRWDRPMIIPPGGGTPKAYLRASSLVGFEYRGGLEKWAQRHLLVNVAKRPDLVLSGQSVTDPDDPASKKDLDEWVAVALESTRVKARIGTALHRLTEQVDATGKIPPVGAHEPALRAYRDVMSSWFEVLHSEAFLVNDELGAAGTTDRVVRLKVWMQPCDKKGQPDGPPLPPGTILILDLKTSGDSKYFGAKFCGQLAVYHGGQLYDLRTGARTPLGDLHPRWALILHMPAGGQVAELYWVDVTVGAYVADLALEARTAERVGKQAITRAAIEPWAPDEFVISAEDPPELVAKAFARRDEPEPTHAGTVFGSIKTQNDHARLLELIRATRTEAELFALYATNARIWTPEHGAVADQVRAALLAVAS